MQTLQPESVLTLQEAQRLRELERVIDRTLDSFLECGKSLAEIRNGRLYRATHARFADYCLSRWSLSLSRANQLIQSVGVYDNLTGVSPHDAPLLAETGENALRPLARLEPELQVVTWELIRSIEERPSGTTIEQVVTTIREAIAAGWQARTATHTATPSKNGTSHHHRASDQLGAFGRWSNRITTWDPEAIAMADDELRLKRHLQAARKLRTFCEDFIQALETRLATRTI